MDTAAPTDDHMTTTTITKDDAGWYRVHDGNGNLLLSTDVHKDVVNFLFFHL